MNDRKKDPLAVVRAYHERTKHAPTRFAASRGFMDWPNQPNPFRTYSGTEKIALPTPEARPAPKYDELFSSSVDAVELDADFLTRFLRFSLALSAWKQAPNGHRWSLRVIPSSGALYPTEGYLVAPAIRPLIHSAGVFHYSPLDHQLERRCTMNQQQWEALTDGFPQPCMLVGLTSIYWRESWKYGERAFRYCHHDVGHALGALVFAARINGWRMHLLDTIAADDLDRLLGIDTQRGNEAEHSDCLMLLTPDNGAAKNESIVELSPDTWRDRLPTLEVKGTPNPLSRDHYPWPAIDDVSAATRTTPVIRAGHDGQRPSATDRLALSRTVSAETIVLQRRSAVAMDGTTRLSQSAFFHILQRTLPGNFPFASLPFPPQVSLAIFVHQVEDLKPGLYLCARTQTHEHTLRTILKPQFAWEKPEACPDSLPLFRLMHEDFRNAARTISCQQDIAGEGIFSVGMLAQFDGPLKRFGARFYPRLFWETGIIGQVLYLEAEAAGIRGTGIGCFFDDLMHALLGIDDTSWQSLYHFTVGGPIDDPRLKTLAAYGHLDQSNAG